MGITTNRLKAALFASAAVTMGTMSAAAAQTNEAGEVIVNTFTLDYAVGGTPQTQITNGDANDPTVGTAFTVDRKVDLDVSSRGDNTGAVPGQQDVPLFFVVTNEGNDNFRYQLGATNRPDGASNDEFDADNLELAAVLLPNGTTDCSEATNFPAGSVVAQNGANNTDVPIGGLLCVRVVGDVPNTASNGNDAGIFLAATAVQPDAWANQGQANTQPGANAVAGTPLVAAGNNQIEGAAQNVFVDAAGEVTGDAIGDARHSDVGELVVSSALLNAQKSVFAVATDGAGCATATAPASQDNGEYAVPGACIVYTITVNNSGSVAANDVDIDDLMPAGVTFAGIAVSGFTNGTLSPAETATTCAVDGNQRCPVSLADATLDPNTDGVITIRALVD